MIELTTQPEGVVVPVRAQPGARKNAVVGEHAGSLRVAVSAAPEQGKANEAIAEVLAGALGCRTSRITLLSGKTSRSKRFLILDGNLEEIRARLAQLVPPTS
jgi:uncharacterized protein (TIGR00251 family)